MIYGVETQMADVADADLQVMADAHVLHDVHVLQERIDQLQHERSR